MAMFDHLHFEPSPYEKALHKWNADMRARVIALMESDGIYDLPLAERAGAWGERWDIVQADLPKPDIKDYTDTFEGNQRDVLLACCHHTRN